MKCCGLIDNSVECDSVDMRMKIEQISGGVQCHNGTRFGVREIREGSFEIARIRFPSTAIKMFAECAIVFEVDPEPLRQAEHQMPLGKGREEVFVQVFCKDQSAFGITARAQTASLAGECDELRVFAVLTVSASAAVSEYAAVEVSIEGADPTPPKVERLKSEYYRAYDE